MAYCTDMLLVLPLIDEEGDKAEAASEEAKHQCHNPDKSTRFVSQYCLCALLADVAIGENTTSLASNIDSDYILVRVLGRVWLVVLVAWLLALVHRLPIYDILIRCIVRTWLWQIGIPSAKLVSWFHIVALVWVVLQVWVSAHPRFKYNYSLFYKCTN